MDKFFGIAGSIFLAVLYVLLFLTVLAAFLCVSHPKIIIKYKDKLEISASLWFVRFNITKFFSRTKKKKKPHVIHFDGSNFGELPKEDKPDKKKMENREREQKQAPATRKKEKKPISETVSEKAELITDILSDISDPLKNILTVHIKRLYITTASGDAHKTALLFGYANTAAGSLIYACRKFAALGIDEKHVGVYSDFIGTKPVFDTLIVLTLSSRHIIICTYKALMKFIKRKA